MTKLEINDLADSAYPIDESDYGSERQVEAFNLFCSTVSDIMTAKQIEAWDAYSMKATNDEIIDKALEILGAI